jgi:peptidoglycan hydrolase-like protein with peptidoglycan-binding domain
VARRAATGAALVVVLAVGWALPAAAQSVVVVPGGGPDVRLFDSGGNNHGSFFAYDPGFDGGVHVAVGDVNGDGRGEIVTGAGPGGGPAVRILDGAGNLESSFFAYASSFPGGVHVAVGDVDGDKRGEIITGAGPGGGPQVRILDAAGNAKGSFFPYDQAFQGGVNVAVGDVDGDSRPDIVTGAGPGGGPNVKVFDGAGNLKSSFFAYDPGFTGGVSVAVGDVDGDGRPDIVTGPGPGGGPNVRVFDAAGNLKSSFFAYDPGFAGGITVAAGALGGPRIVTGPGATGGPEVRVFDATGNSRADFLAYDPGYRGGVNVAVGNVDGTSRIVTGAGVERVLRVLHPGDTGADVMQMQQRLSDLGYWVPVDGSFGTLTQQAVWAFEKVQGLARDGVFGGDNWSALTTAARPQARSGGDLLEVDKARQVLFLVRDGQVVWTFNTSTGTEGPYTFGGQQFIAHTPTGGFTIISQFDGYQTGRLGTLYRPKYFTTWGVAVHGSPSIPPYPASHGCVRVSNAAIDFIWNNGLAPLGSTVIVY